MSAGAQRPPASWLELERRALADAAATQQMRQEQFETLLARVATRVRSLAANVEAKQAVLELTPRPSVDLASTLQKLTGEGPQALTRREARAVVSHPDRLPAEAVRQVLDDSPTLLGHLVRAVLSNWYQYCTQSWGTDCFQLIAERAPGSGIPLLEKTQIGAVGALSRAESDGAAQLAASLPSGDLGELHRHLKDDLGLRDSWLYTGHVLAWWLTAQVERGRSVDGALETIRGDLRLRSILLPPLAANNNAAAGVRLDPTVHARSVAALLRASFSTTPQLARSGLSSLTQDLMRSDFGDPRLPPMSEGWKRVKALAEQPFRGLLATLSEQDLEVFFGHAMNEPERQKFWLRYLPSIERTGCVLDKDSQERLRVKLRGSPEMEGAIERAYRYKHSSTVQAFFLVFADLVVVEFSDTGNAAYVYERAYFEQKLEHRIRAGRCDGIGELKLVFHCVHRIGHQRGWQGKVEQWLSERGVHPRKR